MNDISRNQAHISSQMKWNMAHPGKTAEASRKYRSKNREKLREQSRNWYAKNREKGISASMRWASENKEKRVTYRVNARAVSRLYENKKYKDDINFRLGRILRARLRKKLKDYLSRGHISAVKSLGCTLMELKVHIEKLFQPGMSWDNWGVGGWHIDHKLPFDCFDLSDAAQVAKVCHFSNLTPMWAEENLKKGKKVSGAY